MDLAVAAGLLRRDRPGTARRRLGEAERLVDTVISRRARDSIHRGLVTGLTSWPNAYLGEGVDQAERWAAETKSALVRSECYEELAMTFLP